MRQHFFSPSLPRQAYGKLSPLRLREFLLEIPRLESFFLGFLDDGFLFFFGIFLISTVRSFSIHFSRESSKVSEPYYSEREANADNVVVERSYLEENRRGKRLREGSFLATSSIVTRMGLTRRLLSPGNHRIFPSPLTERNLNRFSASTAWCYRAKWRWRITAEAKVSGSFSSILASLLCPPLMRSTNP